MKKLLSVIIVIAMTAALCLTSSAVSRDAQLNFTRDNEGDLEPIHEDPIVNPPTGGYSIDEDCYVSCDQVFVENSDESWTDLANFGDNKQWGTELKDISDKVTDGYIYLHGWIAAPREIRDFGYSIYNGETSETVLGSPRAETEYDVVEAGKRLIGEDADVTRFKIKVPVVEGDDVTIDALVRFAEDDYGENLWHITYTYEKLDGGLSVKRMNVVVDGTLEPLEYNMATDDTVEVKIDLINNPGLSSLRAVTSWSEKLTLIDARYDIYDEEDNSAMINLPGTDEEFEPVWDGVSSPFVFNWLTARNVIEGDRTYVTLTFKVSEDAEPGEFLPVDIDVSAIDVFAGLDETVLFKTINGGVTVVRFISGDVDDDGFICNKDVVALFRFVNGMSISLNERAADFNLDKEVNNKDVVALFRFASELYDEKTAD